MKIDRNNSGFLHKNDRKELETHADYKGSVNIEGEQYWLNAWINTDKNGKKYMSLRFNLKEESRARTEKPLKVVGGKETSFDDGPDDSIPF